MRSCKKRPRTANRMHRRGSNGSLVGKILLKETLYGIGSCVAHGDELENQALVYGSQSFKTREQLSKDREPGQLGRMGRPAASTVM